MTNRDFEDRHFHSNWWYVGFVLAGLFLTRGCDDPAPNHTRIEARCATEYGLEPC